MTDDLNQVIRNRILRPHAQPTTDNTSQRETVAGNPAPPPLKGGANSGNGWDTEPRTISDEIRADRRAQKRGYRWIE